MKRLIQLSFGVLLAASATLQCHAFSNNFTTNDLYLGFTESGAPDDYILDLGQPSAVGAGGTQVKDLSSQFSLSTFNSVFSGGPDGVVMAVIGANNTFNHGDVYGTQLRTANFGIPSLPGSSINESNLPSADLTAAAGTLGTIMVNTGKLPSAGGSKLDASLSYTAVVESSSPSQFYAKSGVMAWSTIGASSNIVMDLWLVPASSPTNVYLGYFTFDLSTGTPKFTFTPSGAAATGPVAGFTGTPVAGAAPLQVVFTDASTGGITNWVWAFGDGHSVTNTSNANVTNTYAAAGTYTASLTVTGPGGNNTLTRTGYIAVSGSAPAANFSSVTFSGGKLVVSGTNGSFGVQYRILSSTNLAGTWVPVFTNNFLTGGSFSYTNSATTNRSGFFRLVSP
jgi:PKD repeat protein